MFGSRRRRTRAKKENRVSVPVSLFTRLADDAEITTTLRSLTERGFSAEVVDGLDAARRAVLARIPAGASVMTNASMTLDETGIASAIEEGSVYQSARKDMAALDPKAERQQRKAIAGQADFALGSVHAITYDGALFIASASGSQLAAYSWGAAKVIFVVGTQKLVPDTETARRRIFEHSLQLSLDQLREVGRSTYVGKLLEIRQEVPERIHIVLVRTAVGF
jgi:hypothetical protein